ncbi:MAG: AraC family transcriptional regulator [Longimicrobiales bacterium]
MALLALLQPDARGLARVREALRAHHELVECSSWRALVEAVRDRPIQVCIIDLYHPTSPVSTDDLGTLVDSRPDVAVLVYSDFSERPTELYRLGQAHVDAVIMAGFDDNTRQIQEATTKALSAAVATRVARSLEGRVLGLELEALLWSAENALSRPRVADLAVALGVSPWQLARGLRGTGVSSARQVLLWGRLFQGGRLLGEPQATVEKVAFRLGYSSDAAFRRALRDNVGYAPTDVIRRGGLECVLEGFLDGRMTKS